MSKPFPGQEYRRTIERILIELTCREFEKTIGRSKYVTKMIEGSTSHNHQDEFAIIMKEVLSE